MIVLDASVVAEVLLHTAVARMLREYLLTDTDWAAPHLIDAEVGHVLRRQVAFGSISESRARAALAALTRMRMQRYDHIFLLSRAFDLRANASFYDALYLALAEALHAAFVTRDGSLRNVPGCRARVVVL